MWCAAPLKLDRIRGNGMNFFGKDANPASLLQNRNRYPNYVCYCAWLFHIRVLDGRDRSR